MGLALVRFRGADQTTTSDLRGANAAQFSSSLTRSGIYFTGGNYKRLLLLKLSYRGLQLLPTFVELQPVSQNGTK